jgi:hypothetical protein
VEFDVPVKTLEDAERYFKAMGCSHFHMSREYPARYSEYQFLQVNKRTEAEWIEEEIWAAVDLLGKATTEWSDLWAIHTRLTDLVVRNGFEGFLECVLAATSKIEARLPQFDKLLVAETIVGRQKPEYRPGLIFRCHDSARQDQAHGYYRLGRRLVNKVFQSQEHEQRRQDLLAALAVTATCCNLQTEGDG